MIVDGFEEIIVQPQDIDFIEYILKEYFKTHEDKVIYKSDWVPNEHLYNSYMNRIIKSYRGAKRYIMPIEVYKYLEKEYEI